MTKTASFSKFALSTSRKVSADLLILTLIGIAVPAFGVVQVFEKAQGSISLLGVIGE